MNDENVIEKFRRGKFLLVTRFVILRLPRICLRSRILREPTTGALIGHRGLTPADFYLSSIHAELGCAPKGYCICRRCFGSGAPTWECRSSPGSDSAAFADRLGGYANAIVLAVLWGMYMSIVHIGQIGTATVGIQLLETGSCRSFFARLLDGSHFEFSAADLVFWLFAGWLSESWSAGGLIKLRGDECWRDLTCMYYTTKAADPNTLSRYPFRAIGFINRDSLEHTVELVVRGFIWAANRASHRRRIAGSVPGLSHY